MANFFLEEKTLNISRTGEKRSSYNKLLDPVAEPLFIGEPLYMGEK